MGRHAKPERNWTGESPDELKKIIGELTENTEQEIVFPDLFSDTSLKRQRVPVQSLLSTTAAFIEKALAIELNANETNLLMSRKLSSEW